MCAADRALSLAVVLERLGDHEPRLLDGRWTPWHAATAIVLRERDAVAELLFIVRTTRDDDRWSGQVAFPGGRRDPEDETILHTSRREAREEVGIELDEPVTRLDDQQGRTSLGRVSPFVFTAPAEVDLRPDPHEVAETLWVPLPHLLDPANATRHRFLAMSFPGIDLGRATLWGLTLRTLETFLEATGLDRS